MKCSFNISSFREMAGGAAPRSLRSLHANLANRWAQACSGARVAQRYITALSSGGLHAQPRPAKS